MMEQSVATHTTTLYEVYDCWPKLINATLTYEDARQLIERDVITRGGYIFQSQPAPLPDGTQHVLTTCGIYIIKEMHNAD